MFARVSFLLVYCRIVKTWLVQDGGKNLLVTKVKSTLISIRSYRVLQLMTTAFIFFHFCACFWVFLLSLSHDGNNWYSSFRVEESSIDHESKLRLYILSFYYTILTVATVGYGDLTPINTG